MPSSSQLLPGAGHQRVMDVRDFLSLLDQLGLEFGNLHASHEQLIAQIGQAGDIRKTTNLVSCDGTITAIDIKVVDDPGAGSTDFSQRHDSPENEPGTAMPPNSLPGNNSKGRKCISMEQVIDLDDYTGHTPSSPLSPPTIFHSASSQAMSENTWPEGPALETITNYPPSPGSGGQSPRRKKRGSGISSPSKSNGSPRSGSPRSGSPTRSSSFHLDLIKVFNQLDADGSGNLNARKLCNALAAAGIPRARVGRLLQLADNDNSGTIELNEWLDAVRSDDPEMQWLSRTLRAKMNETGGNVLADVADKQYCMLDPVSYKRILWDTWMSALCLHIAIFLPFSTAFESLLSEGTAARLLLVDRFVNYFFMIDILINFRTGYMSYDGKVVMEWRAVAGHYLRRWFMFDLMSSLPAEDLQAMHVDSLQAVKVLKISKLLKIVRIIRPRSIDPAEISDTLDDVLQSKVAQWLSRKLSVFCYLLLLCHWMACGMKLVDSAWLSKHRDIGGNLWAEYLTAVYWSMTTLTTVGYGDVIPTSHGEMIYTIVAMVVGGGFYGYVVGAITSLVANSDLNAQAYHERMDLIHAWLNHHHLPPGMKRTLRRHFRHFLSEKSAISEADVFQDLSHELQTEVGMYLIHEDVKGNPLFDGIGIGSVVRLQSILKRVTIEAGCNVIKGGEVGTAMYIIVSGFMKMLVWDPAHEQLERAISPSMCPSMSLDRDFHQKGKKRPVSVTSPPPSEYFGECPSSSISRLDVSTELYAGQYFGEEILLGFSDHYEYTVKALEKSKMEMIQQGEFLNTFQMMPNILERIRRNALELHPEWKDLLTPGGSPTRHSRRNCSRIME